MSAANAASGGSARSRPHHEAEALLEQLAQDLGREEAAARARAVALTASASTKVLEERGVPADVAYGIKLGEQARVAPCPPFAGVVLA